MDNLRILEDATDVQIQVKLKHLYNIEELKSKQDLGLCSFVRYQWAPKLRIS